MDERWGLAPMVKVEVVVSGEDTQVVTDLFSTAGAVGFTAVANVSGVGHGGAHQGRLAFNDRNALALLMVVLPPDGVDRLLDGLRSLLAERPGVLFVSDTYVSRPEYFR
ncbi:MAG: P-II family nitrogen regulator [Acidimicrobiales bacterium]